MAISTRRRDVPKPAWTWLTASPEPRAASSARRRSSRASALEPVDRRRTVAPVTRDAAAGQVSDVGRAAAAAAAGHRRGGLGRPEEAPLAEVGGVGEPGGLPRDHPDAGAPLASRGQLLDPAVVEHGRRIGAVLGEHLGELAAVTQRLRQHPLQHGGIDHHGLLAPLPGARWPTSVSVAYRTGVAPRTGLSARIELEVTEADTAEAFRTGSVPVLATPRLVALCEEASCLAIEGHLPPGGTSVAKRVQFDHLVPVGVGGPSGPRRRWTGSRAGDWCSPCRSPRTAAWSAPASSSGSSSTGPRSSPTSADEPCPGVPPVSGPESAVAVPGGSRW